MFYFLSLDPLPGAATQGAPAQHDDPPPCHHPSLGLTQSPGPDPNSPKLKQTNTNNQMNKLTVLTLMLPIQYTTVQYSNRRGGWCHSTFHSVCGVRGLDLLSVTNVNKSTSAAQDPRFTVQFNPPLFWTYFLGGGDFFYYFFGGGIFFVFFVCFFTVQYCTV